MKNLFNLSLMAGLLAVCCGFTACSSSDDEEQQKPAPDQPVNAMRLVEWTTERIRDGEVIENYKFEYNFKGQIVKLTRTESGSSTRFYSYVYGDDEITVSDGYRDYVYTLSNGRIVSKKEQNGIAVTNYEYDDNGYLTSEKRSDIIDHTYQYTWKDGNIVEIRDNDGYPRTFSYTDYPSSMLPLLSYFLTIDEMVLEMQGYFGKRCKNLPSKVDYISIFKNLVTDTYDYTISEGVVTKLVNSTSINNFTWAKQ